MEREVSNFVHTQMDGAQKTGNYLAKLRDWVAWTKKKTKNQAQVKKNSKEHLFALNFKSCGCV